MTSSQRSTVSSVSGSRRLATTNRCHHSGDACRKIHNLQRRRRNNRFTSSTMKRRRVGQSFLPEAIEHRLEERKQAQDKCTKVLDELSSLDILSLFTKDVTITEEQALVLLSAKLTFAGVVRLQMALDHVPATINMKSRGEKEPLRFCLVSEILAAGGIDLDAAEVRQYADILQRYCPSYCQFKFDQGDTLWKLTGEGKFRFNKFITPPVESCLSCHGSLTMHRQPTNAVVYGSTGPYPASKIALECGSCNMKYGIGSYSDGCGKHLYHESHSFIEVSNQTYVDRNLYKWIPSLG